MIIDHKGAKIQVTLVNLPENLPAGIRQFYEKLLGWYQRQGWALDATPDDFIKNFPTTLFKIGRFTFCFQEGGKRYPGDVSLVVFNENGVAVDSSDHEYSMLGMPLPSRSHHGARTVDGNTPMIFVPRDNQRNPFVPPQ